MYAMRSAAARVPPQPSQRWISRSTLFRGTPCGGAIAARSTSAAHVAVPARGVGSSRSRAVFLSALATLGATRASSASTAAAFTASSLTRTAITIGGVRLVATSAASTLAVSLLMPQRVMCAGRGGEGDDDDHGDGKGKGNALSRMARRLFLGGGDNADGRRLAKGGSDRSGGGDDAENAKKLVQDLTDAFSNFGDDVTKAVDGAVKRKNEPSTNQDNLGDVVRRKLNELMEGPAPAQISFGFGMGVCCGFAAKKTAKVALVGVGLAFGSLQLLSYMGYLELDYEKLEGEVMTALDLDKNGKVDTDDVQALWDRTMKVLTYNLPTGSGFVAGALLGARMG